MNQIFRFLLGFFIAFVAITNSVALANGFHNHQHSPLMVSPAQLSQVSASSVDVSLGVRHERVQVEAAAEIPGSQDDLSVRSPFVRLSHVSRMPGAPHRLGVEAAVTHHEAQLQRSLAGSGGLPLVPRDEQEEARSGFTYLVKPQMAMQFARRLTIAVAAEFKREEVYLTEGKMTADRQTPLPAVMLHGNTYQLGVVYRPQSRWTLQRYAQGEVDRYTTHSSVTLHQRLRLWTKWALGIQYVLHQANALGQGAAGEDMNLNHQDLIGTLEYHLTQSLKLELLASRASQPSNEAAAFSETSGRRRIAAGIDMRFGRDRSINVMATQEYRSLEVVGRDPGVTIAATQRMTQRNDELMIGTHWKF